MTPTITPQGALIYTMVLVAMADDDITDDEIRIMSEIVSFLPVFRDFEPEKLQIKIQGCIQLLGEEDGLDAAIAVIRDALPPKLRETAYALACDVAAADGEARQSELRLLEMLRHELDIERLAAAGIERGAAARFRMV